MSKPSAVKQLPLARLTFTQRTIKAVFDQNSNIQLQYRPVHKTIKTLGDLLTVSRKQAGLKQAALARAAGITRQWLGRWERGRAFPGEEGWQKLTAVLELPAYKEALTLSTNRS